jgi:hypothetical protein
MAKLTKQQSKNHDIACEVLKKEYLTYEDKQLVLDYWREDCTNNVGVAGAFFTPVGLARDFNIEIPSGCKRIIDMCAGIGTLALQVVETHRLNDEHIEMVCVELNPEYIEVGKKVIPEATWVQGSMLDEELIKSLGHFDCAISNPPFGRVVTGRSEHFLKYTGGEFEYKIIEIASIISDYGVFILPQQSCGFEYSGRQCFSKSETTKYKKFSQQTGLVLEMNCGFDTSCYVNDWHGVKPIVEIALCDFPSMYK